MSGADAPLSRAQRKRYGVLDIGSNSVRLVIYDVYGSSFVPIYSEKIHAGLGRELAKTGRLSPEGCRQTQGALKRFALICDAQSVQNVLIAATAAMREAKDAADYVKTIKSETGFDLTPISGQEEARLSAMGLIAAMPRAKGIAADLGGASLELISVTNHQPAKGYSFPLGPFPMGGTDLKDGRFSPKDLRAKINAVLDGGAAPRGALAGQTLYLIGGAWRNLALIHQQKRDYPLGTMQGYEMSVFDALEMANWAYGAGRAEVMHWPGIAMRRSETLPYGALMLSALIERFTPNRVVVSRTGLREGMIYDALSPEQRARDALLDGCRDLAAGNLQGGASFARPLFKFLEPASRAFPPVFPAVDEDRLRRAACILAGMGKGLHPSYRAALIFEDVLYAPLSGLTHKERSYLALILFRSITGKQSPPNERAVQLLLSPAEQTAASIYGLAIRLAVVASGRSASLLRQLTLRIQDGQPILTTSDSHQNLNGPRTRLRLKRLKDALAAVQSG